MKIIIIIAAMLFCFGVISCDNIGPKANDHRIVKNYDGTYSLQY